MKNKKDNSFEESRRVWKSSGFIKFKNNLHLNYFRSWYKYIEETSRKNFNFQVIEGILAGSRNSKGRGILDGLKNDTTRKTR
jgi:hypothetical protein